MSLAGEGAVAIWHDLAPEGRETFYAWHGEEHMPERVGIPGFLRGRRYVAIRPGIEFFNLYEAASPQTLMATDYLHRLNNPTPWTRSAVSHFRNVSRSICKVAATFGRGCGGLVATWRYDVPDAVTTGHRRTMVQRILPALAGEEGVSGVHLLVADMEASAIKTEEHKGRPEANRIPRWILVVEGWGDEEPFEALCRQSLGNNMLMADGRSHPAETGLYRLQNTRLKTDWAAG